MQTSLFKRNAILIEQNPIHCRLYEDLLDANGFEVYIAKSVMDALMKIKEKSRDLTVINTEIVDEKFIKKFILKTKEEENSKNMSIIGISIYPEEKKKYIANFLDSFLTKPFSVDTFIGAVGKCFEEKDDIKSSCC